MKTLVIVLTVLAGIAVGEMDLVAESTELTESRETGDVVKSNNAFAVSLYDKLKREEGNLFFSPFSISTALAMTYAGAKGETASQMSNALRFALKADRLHHIYGAVMKDLNARGETGGYELSVANALWGQKGVKLLEQFLDLVQASYGAGVKDIDFAGDPEAARLEINGWVEEKTKEKIKNLLARGTITPLTRLVLTNAIYFKGDWASKFDEARTQDAPFFLVSGDSVDVPFMSQTDEYAYMETEDFQALSLPYVNEELSMVVLLPRKNDGLSALEDSLSQENLAGWTQRFHKREVTVYLPKFKMTSAFKLNEVLESLGIVNAFDPGLADFSGMTGNRDFYMWAVVHKAYVDVNEEGTEAAAATGVVMGITSVMPEEIPVFRADHPFIFMIRDNKTKSILFMGRLAEPEE
ncbi:MAG: serpin family protein [Candidatus Latescibacteria bacterium]|nr:serpin family protein [Candidatus Latescibacterota bacterium]NIM21698.1 serpin family protein [Candidatus Latescibacterota bacterium]NIM65725.1 serpin family protein [Candidatus Latescibacterota bacterium]NIO02110.1 serpin family protein [Candidatus Latescibacterota bacterium]NIO28927.1 serpin family protein [Candidatus Latescibacterota bacterium]